MNALQQDTSRFKIGAVARLTGIPVETLRVWERRYQTVTPHRAAGGSRLYDRQDVARLIIIKRLVDAGNAISTIAQLSLEQLEERESSSDALQTSRLAREPANIAIVGSTLPLRLGDSFDPADGTPITLVGRYADLRQVEEEEFDQPLDGLIVEEPVLIQATVARLRRLQRTRPVARMVVVYGYGKRESVRELENAGITVCRYPPSWPELIKALDIGQTVAAPASLNDDSADILASPYPVRRFNDGQLARIATVTTDLNCECPHHIVDLVMSLHRFELYSAECEDLSDEDAALHAYLHQVTARSRSLMEAALQRVIESDGINLDDLSPL